MIQKHTLPVRHRLQLPVSRPQQRTAVPVQMDSSAGYQPTQQQQVIAIMQQRVRSSASKVMTELQLMWLLIWLKAPAARQ